MSEPLTKVYTYHSVLTMPAGNADMFIAVIPIPSRRARLRSVFWSVNFREFPIGNVIPLGNNITQDFSLELNALNPGNLGNIFHDEAWAGAFGVTVDYFTGSQVFLTKPGQYHWDNLLILYDMYVIFRWNNTGLLPVMAHSNVVVEVEDISVL